MKKISTGFKVSGEEDDTATPDHRSPPLNSLRRFGSSEIRFTLSLNLCLGNHGGTLVFKDGDVDTTPGLPATVPRNSNECRSPVYSPVPLLSFHPDFDVRSSDQINRVGESVHDDHEGAELTLRLSPISTSRNPNPPIEINWSNSGSGSYDVVPPTVKDEVNTELDLGLNLSIMPLSGKKEKPIKPEKRGRLDGGDDASEEGTEKKRRRRTKRKHGDDEEQRPSIPIEQIPVLQETLESRGGTRPVFLYKKRLEASDVLKDQNRLLMTKAKKLMEFLTEEEAMAVNGGTGRGLKFVGVDSGGRVYVTGEPQMSEELEDVDHNSQAEGGGEELHDVHDEGGRSGQQMQGSRPRRERKPPVKFKDYVAT